MSPPPPAPIAAETPLMTKAMRPFVKALSGSARPKSSAAFVKSRAATSRTITAKSARSDVGEACCAIAPPATAPRASPGTQRRTMLQSTPPRL